MLAALIVPVVVGGILIPQGAAFSAQDRTAEAALEAAEERAQCPDCDFDYATPAPRESARRGLVSIGVGEQGGGYVTIMGYTGTRWAALWEGNGSTRNVFRLPGRIAICMAEGGWTNVRKGPGLQYKRVARVSSPTVKKAFALRLTDPLGAREGVAWYRISLDGRRAWVQNLRTIAAPRGSADKACGEWRKYWSTPQ